jgi:hypothetical protein
MASVDEVEWGRERANQRWFQKLLLAIEYMEDQGAKLCDLDGPVAPPEVVEKHSQVKVPQ